MKIGWFLGGRKEDSGHRKGWRKDVQYEKT